MIWHNLIAWIVWRSNRLKEKSFCSKVLESKQLEMLKLFANRVSFKF